MKEIDANKIVFLIAHKYFRGNENYLEYYVRNIKKFYENSLVVVCDNNSKYLGDISDRLLDVDRLVFLKNESDEKKYEIGAYTVGLRYLIENNLDKEYQYAVFSQDSFIIKKRYDFENLLNKGIMACPIVGDRHANYLICDLMQTKGRDILEKFGIFDNLEKLNFVLSNSFVTHCTKIRELYGYFKEITMKDKGDSCAGERYLSRILFQLDSENANFTIDGDIRDHQQRYDFRYVNVYSEEHDCFFVKKFKLTGDETMDRH